MSERELIIVKIVNSTDSWGYYESDFTIERKQQHKSLE